MRKTEIIRWLEKTPLPGCGSTTHIDHCCVFWQSAEHLLGPKIASLSIELCNLANAADSVQVCYDSSPAYSNTTADEMANREAISTSPHAIFAKDFLDVTCQERINYPGSGGAMGPHDLSPNTVEEAKAAARGIENARVTKRLAESALSRPHISKDMPGDKAKPRGNAAAGNARKFGSTGFGEPKDSHGKEQPIECHTK